MRLKTSLKKRFVIEHALALYNLHGIEATTVEMVCDEAKISVGSFYHHFGSKEGLALAVYTVGLKDFSLYLSAALQTCKTIRQVVTVIVNANIDWIHQNRIWAKFIFEQRHILASSGQENSFQESVIGMQTHWKEYISALEGKEILLKYPPEFVISLLIGPVHEYARHWLNGRYQTDLILLKQYFCAAAWASLNFEIEA